ncbi:MAG: TRAP transporter large permease subunit [Pseudomonadota bacterium]|nr:TRAP transporter large permease subunit [Pseudomonadota bacterium]
MDATVFLILGMIALFAVLGMHLAFAFAFASVIGLAISFGGIDPAADLLQQTALMNLNSYTLVVLPLFAVMGIVIGASGAASDLFHVINRGLKFVPARLAVATVAGNAVFAAVTGVGAASVVAFSRIAYPEMKKAGYADSFSTGVIAGSAVLGLLIPPSVFMIVFALLTSQSVGKLFAGGLFPGLLMAAFFAIYCIITALARPRQAPKGTFDAAPRPGAHVGALSVAVLILITLGGIWGGFLTPTEGAGVGLFGSFVVALIKRMPIKAICKAVFDAGTMITPILLLMLGAAMYSKLLAIEGVPQMIGAAFEGSALGPVGTMLIFVVIWLICGCLIDSISIMLLTVPIFWPIAQLQGIDPIVFALIGILIIEAGVLTPPFGIAVFIAKSALPDSSVSVGQIFRGVAPYWIIILIVALLLWVFPDIATWLPSKI